MNHVRVYNVIAFVFMLLFTYTAFSKLLDYERFRVQIAETQWLSPWAPALALGIPLLELIVAAALGFQRYRSLALAASFLLMCWFTLYLIIVLASENKPCSCGGVISGFSWTEHLLFNLVFIVLAFFAWRSSLAARKQKSADSSHGHL